MEATKLSVTGHRYFVPRTFMERVDIFEDFITLLSGLNKKQTPLVVNTSTSLTMPSSGIR